MTNLLEIRNLVKRYDGFTLDGVSLSVEAGSVVGLVGGNGAGKTTLIKAALGLIGPSEGDVLLFGQPVVAGAKVPSADVLRRDVGVVLDTCAFPGEVRVRDVAAIGRAAFSDWDQRRFLALAQQFDLDAKKRVKELSRGMGMKLSLAFALAHHPRLLVLDEPTAGLDPLAREDVLGLLRTFMEDGERGILISSHITSDLEKIADRVACIDDGCLVFDRPKDEVCDFPGIARCRTADFERIVATVRDGKLGFSEGFRFMRNAYGIDVLVPDRFAFSRVLSDIDCDRCILEDYLTLILRGETL